MYIHVYTINRVHSYNHMCIYMYLYQECIKAPLCVCLYDDVYIHVHLYMYPVTFSVSFGPCRHCTHACWDMAAVMGPKSA